MAFRQARQRHPGVESAIGALQAGNGLKRCRDRSKRGYERYVGLGIWGGICKPWASCCLPRTKQVAKRPSPNANAPPRSGGKQR